MDFRYFVIVFFLFTISIASAQNLFNHCESPHGKIVSITALGCDHGKDPTVCTLKKGTEAAFTVNFIPNFEAKSAKIKILSTMNGMTIPLPMIPNEACSAPQFGLTCPLEPGKESKIEYKMLIKPFYPEVKTQIQLRLVDESESNLICAEFKAEIVGQTLSEDDEGEDEVQ